MVKDVAIIGAGIGGLTLAYYLERAGLDIVVLESSGRPGGRVESKRANGFLLERGANSTLARKPLKKLISELELDSEVIFPQANAKNRYVTSYRNRKRPRLVPVPRNPGGIVSTPLLSPRAKLRLLKEPFVASTQCNDESVYEFMSRRLGTEITENVIAATLAGIWAADITKLSCRSALQKVWSYEQQFGSIVRGVFKDYQKRKKDRPVALSFRDGMSTLPRALASKLQFDTLSFDSIVTEIRERGDFTEVCYQDADGMSMQHVLARRIVLTTPAVVSSALVQAYDSGLAEQIRSVYYAPVGVLHLSCATAHVKHALDGFGFLSPPRPNKALLGTIFSSSLFAQRAPDGQALFTCFAGGASNPELADVREAAVQRQVIAELSELVSASGELDVRSAHYWPRAIPNFSLQHYQLQDAVESFERQHPQLRILANWHRGLGVADRVDQAAKLAATLQEELRLSGKLPAQM